MRLVLIRHAKAGERDPKRWPDDRQRPLTDDGRKIQGRVATWLKGTEWVPTVLLTSPWTRARETAEITAERLGLGRPFQTESLTGPPDLARIQEAIGARPESAVVGLVGHSPYLDQLAALLLVGRGGRLQLDWKKSGVMVIDIRRIAPGEGTLVAFVPPGVASSE